MRSFWRFIAFLVVALPVASFSQIDPLTAAVRKAAAKNLEGTIYAKAQQESADGKIVLCGIEFSAVTFVTTTNDRQPVTLDGTFSIGKNRGSLAYLLKLGVKYGLEPVPKLVAPFNAFVSAPDGPPPLQPTSLGSFTPGYGSFAGPFSKEILAAYQAIVNNKKLLIGFNRKPNDLDVTTVLDLSVVTTDFQGEKAVRKRSNDAVSTFNQCTTALAQAPG